MLLESQKLGFTKKESHSEVTVNLAEIDDIRNTYSIHSKM